MWNPDQEPYIYICVCVYIYCVLECIRCVSAYPIVYARVTHTHPHSHMQAPVGDAIAGGIVPDTDTHTPSLSLTRSRSLSRARALSLSLSLAHTHTHSRAHTHTHTRMQAPGGDALASSIVPAVPLPVAPLRWRRWHSGRLRV